MKQQHILITAISVAAALGIGFYGGTVYQKQQSPMGIRQFGSQTNRQFTQGQNQQGTMRGFRPVSGQIIASDDTSITVKMNDGSSKIILLTQTTVINQASKATKEDLKTGTTVAVFGTTNTDGSVTAQSVQLNPQELQRGPVTPEPTK